MFVRIPKGGTLTNWVKGLLTYKIIQKSDIIFEGSRHPNIMNPFEYGKSFHNKSYPKRIGTFIPPSPKIFRGGHNVPPAPLVFIYTQIGWS